LILSHVLSARVVWDYYTLYFTVPHNEEMPESQKDYEYYCPRCEQPVADPLACGDCSAIICRRCGTPLERVDELGIG
jgi:hypothetical protein